LIYRQRCLLLQETELVLDKNAKGLVRLIKNQALSSFEVTDYFIGRIEAHNGAVNAVIAERFEAVRKEAQLADEMAAGFHSGLISLSELKLEYMKAHRNAYGERMTEAQERQLERRLTKLCQMN